MASPLPPNPKPDLPLSAPRQSTLALALPTHDILLALTKRIYIPYNSSSPAGLIEAETVDPWTQSGKYALGFVYFGVVLLVLTAAKRVYYLWKDKLRIASHEDQIEKFRDEMRKAHEVMALSPRLTGLSLQSLASKASIEKIEQKEEIEAQASQPLPHQQPRLERTIDILIALLRFLVYRPLPSLILRRTWRPLIFPSLPAAFIIISATLFTTLYIFVPQPLYWSSIAFGSPPLAIRSGMLALAMIPWILALSMKANLISLITGIGHERLNVLHRWGGWLCVVLSVVHAVPFYVTPVWESAASRGVWKSVLGKGGYVYGSGIACLIPLLFLGTHSLPPLRAYFHRTFLTLHIPISFALLALLFWHVRTNLPSMTLTTYAYLLATVGILTLSYAARLCFFLNFTNPWRLAWLVGDSASISLLPSDAVRITITTRVKWRPGQYAYLRLPSVSLLVSHPFTITSLCTPGLPEHVYAPPRMAEGYREMVFLIRPSSSYAQRLLAAAETQEPGELRAFLDGPYGGMARQIEAFETVLLIAGGSGITALMSQLGGLVRAVGEGRAVTRSVRVVWAVKRAESLAWFEDDLRVYREVLGSGMLKCEFYVTGARGARNGQEIEREGAGVGENGNMHPYIGNQQETGNDAGYDKEMMIEDEDAIAPLPQAHLKAERATLQQKRVGEHRLSLSVSPTRTPQAHAPSPPQRHAQYLTQPLPHPYPHPHPHPHPHPPHPPHTSSQPYSHFTFTSPATAHRTTDPNNLSIQHGRPDIPFLLRQEWTKEFGQRNCVFVCGPPGMRRDVARGVAEAQRMIWSELEGKRVQVQEVWLHAENFAL